MDVKRPANNRGIIKKKGCVKNYIKLPYNIRDYHLVLENYMQQPTEEDYVRWLEENLQYNPGKARYYYDYITDKIKIDFIQSAIWKEISNNLNEYDTEYRLKYKYPLLITKEPPEIKIKPYGSMINKTYRKNVLLNKNWPKSPTGNNNTWYNPDDCFSQLNDILRTTIVVKYLDGIDFVIKKIDEVCTRNGVKLNVHYEARDEGYYAVHTYLKQNFEIPGMLWDTKIVSMTIEIQITTQLQEVIRQLTHERYEKQRMVSGIRRDSSKKWQWDYTSEEFKENYLGHILHYVEGMIMEVRDKQQEE
jgi:hypothetical protein